MVSHNSFRLLGYLYGGLCLICSVLLLINAGHLLSNGDNSGVGISSLLFSIVSCVFDVYMIVGIVLRRKTYVNYHLKFVSFIYVLLLIGLFGGCVAMGILVSSENSVNLLISSIVITSTMLFCYGIVTVSIFYILSIWIIRGVNSFIKHETVRLITTYGDELM